MTLRKASSALALASVLLLSACGGGSPDDLRGTDSDPMTYRGETIACIGFGGGKTSTMTCDFAKFYSDHPELLEDKTEGEEEDVMWLEAHGKPLACLEKGSGQSKRIACDWQRLYANHPSAFDK